MLLVIGLICLLSRPGPDDPAASPAGLSPAPRSTGRAAPSPAGTAGAGPTASGEQPPGGPAGAQAVALLATLPTKGRAPKTGYSRDQFGAAWSDDVSVDGGHNGCDTRNDILRRDLVEIVLKPGSHGCAVQSGTLHDPYSAATIAFVRGATTSADVQIDHVVALSDAWQKGAQQLTAQQRADFANDPVNLQAVAGPVNQAKGAGDAATWLPPNKAYRCSYVSRQVAVKAKYALWVTPAEREAIATVLAGCDAASAPAT
ncbi:HNH endonuclease family protein [Cumulibacter manganitolerans]|uniref:HNH endonuclease family protein n=1 Tax=Cumulibacter manganitolerans TaxID=1884992 RepID=UPI001E5F2D2E|nr:HNH endonuclease family protein [Cumulibacter manganitolerans]